MTHSVAPSAAPEQSELEEALPLPGRWKMESCHQLGVNVPHALFLQDTRKVRDTRDGPPVTSQRAPGGRMASQGKSRGSDHPWPSRSRTPAHVPGGTAQLRDSPAPASPAACADKGQARPTGWGSPSGEPDSSLPKVRVTPYSPFKATRSPGSALLHPASPKRRPHVLTPLEASDLVTLHDRKCVLLDHPGGGLAVGPRRRKCPAGPPSSQQTG